MEAAAVRPGEIAAVQIRRNSSGQCGLTLVEIMVVVTIVGLLATIAVTNVILARDRGRLTIIRSNLRQVESAKEQWAIDTRQTNGAPVADVTVLQDYIRGGQVPRVMSETYVPNPLGTPAEATLPPGVKLGTYGPGASIPAP